MRRGPVVSWHEDCFEYNGTGKVDRICMARNLGAGVSGILVFFGGLRAFSRFMFRQAFEYKDISCLEFLNSWS